MDIMAAQHACSLVPSCTGWAYQNMTHVGQTSTPPEWHPGKAPLSNRAAEANHLSTMHGHGRKARPIGRTAGM